MLNAVTGDPVLLVNGTCAERTLLHALRQVLWEGGPYFRHRGGVRCMGNTRLVCMKKLVPHPSQYFNEIFCSCRRSTRLRFCCLGVYFFLVFFFLSQGDESGSRLPGHPGGAVPQDFIRGIDLPAEGGRQGVVACFVCLFLRGCCPSGPQRLPCNGTVRMHRPPRGSLGIYIYIYCI